MLLAEHALVDQAVVAAKDADYDAGRSGSRDLMQWDMEVLPRDGALLRSFAAAIPQDETFVSFVAAVRAAGAAIEIVSDGLGFYVASNLARLDPALADLPVATNDNDVDGDGPADLSRTATRPASCAGRASASASGPTRPTGAWSSSSATGPSDRYAAHHADIVWAKDSLLALGARRRAATSWPGTASRRSRPGSSSALADGRLPATAADLPAWRATHRPLRPDFICGPEAWGEGRLAPDSLGAPAEATTLRRMISPLDPVECQPAASPASPTASAHP